MDLGDRAMDAGKAQTQFLRFVGLNGLVSLAGSVAITVWLAASGLPVLAANAVAVAVCSLANYVLADRLVFATVLATLLTAGVADAGSARCPDACRLAGVCEGHRTAHRARGVESVCTRPNGRPVAAAARRRAAAVVAPDAAADGATVEVPDGAVHHWVGRVFLPGVGLDELVAELQAPTSRRWLPSEVRSIRVAGDGGGGLRVFMRVERASIVDVTYDIEHAVRYSGTRQGTRPAAAYRAGSSSSTTRARQRNGGCPRGTIPASCGG